MILMNQLGEILCRRGEVSWEQVEEALRLQRAAIRERPQVKPLGGILVDEGLIGPQALEQALFDQSSAREAWRALDPRSIARLLECGASLATAADPAEVLHRTLAGALRLVGAAAGVAVLLDAAGRRPPLSVFMGPAGRRTLDPDVPARDGVLQWVLRRGRAALVEEARLDPRCSRDTLWLYGLESRSVVCVPMQSASGRTGALEVINRLDGRPFTRGEGLLLDALADLATLALRNARTLHALAARLKDLRAARARLEAGVGAGGERA